MGWETRGNTRYYYRKHWVNNRVVGEYIGAGYVAEVMAELDARNRRERQRVAAEWSAVVEKDRRSAVALAAVDDLVRLAVAAVLLANGYHQHRRQWRRMSGKVTDEQ